MELYIIDADKISSSLTLTRRPPNTVHISLRPLNGSLCRASSSADWLSASLTAGLLSCPIDRSSERAAARSVVGETAINALNGRLLLTYFLTELATRRPLNANVI